MKQKVEENISKFQIGAISGHRSQEHIFSIKSIIEYYNVRGKGIILSFFDLSKYFDRENLRDCMNELYKADVKGKIYRLIFKLNKDTVVCVETLVGTTEYTEVGETLGQGTNEGAIISSVNLDGGAAEYFADSKKEAEYAGIQLGPVLFQDDIIRAAEDLESVIDGNKRIEAMGESKILDFNLEKCCVVILGNKKFRRKIKNEMDANPIIFCGQPIRNLESEKYLGDYFGVSISESVYITVQKRKGMCERLIREIKVTVEDCRSDSVGGLITGLDIWNMAVVPFLFSNCECWINIPKKAINILTSVVCSFLRALFNTPKSCPIMALFWDTGTLLVNNYIIMKKLLFYHHLLQLSDSALAKQILNKQKEEVSEFGFVSECERFLSELEIEHDPSTFSKNRWKKHILSKIHLKNKSDILTQVQSYKKIDYNKLVSENYGIQPYLKTMTVTMARTYFASRSMMLSSVQINYKNIPEYKANDYRCGCGEYDHQEHLTSCTQYKHLQDGLDMETDIGLVRFYQMVIREREKEKETQTQQS